MHLLLSQASPFVPISAASDKGRTFRKEIIRKGTYYKASQDMRFEVDDAALDNWEAMFALMEKNGVRVPAPVTHTDDPEANRGWWSSIYREGDSLYGHVELSDPELAKTCDVSLYSPAEFIDGKGNKYVRPIVHIALVTNPVIPGLEPFTPISLSQENPMDWTKIKEALEIEEEMTDENAEELILAAIEKLKKPEEEEETEKPVVEEPVAAAAKEVDPTLLSLAQDNRIMKIDQLVADNKITGAVAKQLKERFAGKKLALVLSSKMDDGFDAVIASHRENDPIKLGEHTKGQTIQLSNSGRKSSGESPLVKAAKARAEKRKAR